LLTITVAIKAIIELPVDQNTRALKLLDINASEIRIMLHNQILAIWGSLVSVNVDNNTLTIHKSLPETNTDIQMALNGLEAYQEVRDAAQRLWNDIDTIIVGPRTDINNGSTPSIQIKDVCFEITCRNWDILQNL
jgi:centromere/kinetochore protein ZW10